MKNRALFLSTMFIAVLGCEERQPTEEKRETPDRDERPMREQSPAQTLPKKESQAGVRTDEPKPAEKRERSAMQASDKSSPLAHLPSGCKAVTHAKMSELMELPGVKEHLVPAITEAQAGNSDLKQFFTVLKDGGIDSSKDIDTIALCVIESPTANELQQGTKVSASTSVVVAAKAKVPQRELAQALLSRSGGDGEIVDIDGVPAFTDKKRNLVVGQTQDGIILAAANRETFSRALAGGANYKIPSEQAFALLLPQSSTQATIERFGDPASKKVASNVERAVFVFDAEKKELSLRLDMPDHTQAAEIGGVFEAQLANWQGTAPRDQTEKRFSDLLRNAKVRYEDDIAVVALPVSDDQIEATMKNLADQVRAMGESEKPKGST